MQTTNWPIGEVALRAGVATSAIRYYERIGLLPEAARTSGQRRYDESVLTRLAVIDVAQRAGFTLAETSALMSGFARTTSPSARWEQLARRKLDEVDALIARATAMKRLLEEGIECGCPSLDECKLLVRNP